MEIITVNIYIIKKEVEKKDKQIFLRNILVHVPSYTIHQQWKKIVTLFMSLTVIYKDYSYMYLCTHTYFNTEKHKHLNTFYATGHMLQPVKNRISHV